jgi:hypothetical protein
VILPARVYECDRSEVEELKKTLAYDPYLDPNVVPPSPKEKPSDKMTDEEKKEMAEKDKRLSETLKKLSESLKGKIIFSRQEYSLRDGATLGLKENLSYLYLNAPDEFLKGAEERFRTEFKTIKRAGKEEEAKVIQAIKDEEEKANVGFGSIFGN